VITPPPDSPGIGSFACVVGDVAVDPEAVPGFAGLWAAQVPGTDFATMGCGTLRKMSGPVVDYVVECVKQTLGAGGIPAEEVDRVVFSTTDACLSVVGREFAVTVLTGTGMAGCTPVMVSCQQCCGSVTALKYAWDLFADDAVRHVVLVSFDVTPDDSDRVRSFALFGDAVTSCLISRSDTAGLRLAAAAVGTDHAGLVGQDTFASRQEVARSVYARVFQASGMRLEDVDRVFPTNLYKPLTVFSATAAGVRPDKLHFTGPLAAYGHCGNCDWMINLADYQRAAGSGDGETYLVQASAPGFFGCGLLVGPDVDVREVGTDADRCR
jgi:3-oxoacyl-[acyl-carrier-protein] synthase III